MRYRVLTDTSSGPTNVDHIKSVTDQTSEHRAAAPLQ